ncbi:hypothetical protein ROHU_028853 [Labeo rohita]|uniref:Uncharacterized protein n=1 Tax=Labeo rohita TaxID=84645 RepID=A0A498LZL5_LABRO|nr:hypothetical protein ROHU_028853 [Labeo rohita]
MESLFHQMISNCSFLPPVFRLKVWLQGGTSIIPLRARCHRLISCRTFERHFHVSNYHYGAKATPAALQHGVLASP